MSKSRACWTVSPSMTLNNKLAKPLVVGASGGALKNNLAQLVSSISTNKKIGDWHSSTRSRSSG